MKECTLCEELKELDEFYVRAKGVSAQCKTCLRGTGLLRYYTVGRDNYLRRRYGITLDEYEALLEGQGNCCAVCGRTQDINYSVDHSHTTGEVRGLLCTACNRGIGMLQDDPELLRKAANYLEK